MATPSKKPSAHPKKTPASVSRPQADGEERIDPLMEYDAPTFYNFTTKTPEGVRVDDWFDMREAQIANHEFVEAAYSPITFKKGMERKGTAKKMRTPSTRKAKKVLGCVVASELREVPKMSLEEASELKVQPSPAKAATSTAAKKATTATTTHATAPHLPAQTTSSVVASVSATSPVAAVSMAPSLASVAGTATAASTAALSEEVVVSIHVPKEVKEVTFTMPIAPPKAPVNLPEKPEAVVPAVLRSMPKPAAPPIRKRKLWAKPETQKPVAVAEPDQACEVEAQAEEPVTKQQPVSSVLRPSRVPRVANLLSRTPAARLTVKTPVALKKSPPKAKTAVVKRPTIPVSPRCYHTRSNARSQAPVLTRSQSMRETQTKAKSWATTLTKPKEFSFMSKPAPKKSTVDYVPEKVKELSEFQSLLRAEEEPAPRPQGLTRPVEFHFATTARARVGAVNPREPEPAPSMTHKGLTQPKEFSFATSRRARSTTVETAQPSKLRQTYGAPTKFVSTIGGKRVTVPQAFKLSTTNRSKREEPVMEPKSKVAKTADGPVSKPFAKRTLTVPITPYAARKRKTPEKVVVEEDVQPFKARPVPHVKPFVPEPSHHLTVAEPFELATEARGAVKEEQFRHQVEVELQQQEEARHFVARPVPHPEEPNGVPVVEHSHLTVFEPFHLQSETLAALAKQKLEERIAYEQALEEEMRKFKAHPPPSMKRVPFRLVSSNRPLTVPETPDLKSTVRALDRADFSVEKNNRIVVKETRELHEKALEEESEREEIRKLRKTLVFKATPFVNPSPMRLAPSSRPLTIPESPQLRTTLRNMR